MTAAAKVTPKQMTALQKALSAHPEIGKGNEVRPPSELRSRNVLASDVSVMLCVRRCG